MNLTDGVLQERTPAKTDSVLRFPDGFAWGAATSAYQIEGAAFEDGKGLSIWDTLCMKPGAIGDGTTGAVACDHSHRYLEDVELMRQFGLRAYRFSISWPRVLPDGTGCPNQTGLDFYDRLTDALLAASIEPWVTLYHWDLPRALFLKGGWLSRESVEWFGEYVRTVAERLSDRVTNWITLNEIQGFIGFGYASGGKTVQAPGLDLPLGDVLWAGHHALMAHGRAVQVLRAACVKKPCIGDAPVGIVAIPQTASAADIEAARRAMFAAPASREMFFAGGRTNAWWMDAVHLGRYPEDGLRLVGELLPPTWENDLDLIGQPLDYFGVNIYSGMTVRAGAHAAAETVNPPPGSIQVHCTPECLYWGPVFFHERYGRPIVITENGMANPDWVAVDGSVHDSLRIDFLTRYLRELRRAAREMPVRGYFLWSWMDNFEWTGGVGPRFGIVHVEYATQRRTLKDSALWYRRCIADNGASL